MYKKNALIILGGLVMLASTASAQDVKQKFTQAQQANRNLAKQYTWKTRTELKLKGESKNVKLEQVRYDAAGQLQKTPIGGSPPPEQQQSGGRRGRVKEKVIANKKEEFAEMMQGLAKLVTSYAHLSQEQLQAFTKNAKISQGQGQDAGTIQIVGETVLVPGDSMTIFANQTSMLFHRVVIQTVYEKKPVQLVCSYQDAPSGLNFMAKAVLDYPEKGVQVTVDNFEHQPTSP